MDSSVHWVENFALLFLVAVELRNVPQKVIAHKVKEKTYHRQRHDAFSEMLSQTFCKARLEQVFERAHYFQLCHNWVRVIIFQKRLFYLFTPAYILFSNLWLHFLSRHDILIALLLRHCIFGWSYLFLDLLGNSLEEATGTSVGVDAIVLQLTTSKADAFVDDS